MRRVLIISPHFPPVNAPDAQRVRAGLPHFREFGWEPTVLAVDAKYAAGARDPRLLETLPRDVRVHRCGALPAGLGRFLGFGSLGPRAWFSLCSAGTELLRNGKFDLVFFSTTQFLICTLGRRWRENFGVPFVVDLQDPWRTDYYDRPGAPRPPGGWKYRFAKWQAERLEEPSFEPAAGFVSVSENYFNDLSRRYPWFASRPKTVLPFGASETDMDLARNDSSLVPAFVREPGCIYLVSVGAAGPIMAEALDGLFAALRAFCDREPRARRLRLHFIGTSYAPANRVTETVRPLAAAHGIAELVIEKPERIGYFESLKTMLEADALLLIGSNEPGYSPSKIATYFLADRPVLAFVPSGSVAEARLDELRFAQVARFSRGTPPEVGEFFSALLDDPRRLKRSDRHAALFSEQFSAQACTRHLCEFFDRTISAAASETHD